jgi:hypothetical protein
MRWRVFLTHRHFLVLTDAEPLLYLRDKVNPPAGSRLHGWLLELQAYAFSVIHRPGKQHANADALSRLADRVRHLFADKEFACEVPASLPIAVAASLGAAAARVVRAGGGFPGVAIAASKGEVPGEGHSSSPLSP